MHEQKPLACGSHLPGPSCSLYDLRSRFGAGTHEVRVFFKGGKTPRKDARHNEPALAKKMCDNDRGLLIWQLLKSLDEFANLHS